MAVTVHTGVLYSNWYPNVARRLCPRLTHTHRVLAWWVCDGRLHLPEKCRDFNLPGKSREIHLPENVEITCLKE